MEGATGAFESQISKLALQGLPSNVRTHVSSQSAAALSPNDLQCVTYRAMKAGLLPLFSWELCVYTCSPYYQYMFNSFRGLLLLHDVTACVSGKFLPQEKRRLTKWSYGVACGSGRRYAKIESIRLFRGTARSLWLDHMSYRLVRLRAGSEDEVADTSRGNGAKAC